VAVDPAVSSSKKADACGLIAVGKGADGHAYVLEDATLQSVRPDIWAARAIAMYKRLQADCLIAEVNQGGEMIESVIQGIDASVPVHMVRASRGKYLRAEPVAALYARGLVHHVGNFAPLEDEMCDFGPNGLSSGRSPDRLDALVWAISALKLDAAKPLIRRL
jgi:phage terminase large subunit-like protein